MTSIRWEGGRKYVNGVDVTPQPPPTPMTPPTNRTAAFDRNDPSTWGFLLAYRHARRNYVNLVYPLLQASAMSPMNAVLSDRVLKANAIWGQFMAHVDPSGRRIADLYARAQARHDDGRPIRADNGQQISADDLTAEVRTAIVDAAREATFTAWRAVQADARTEARTSSEIRERVRLRSSLCVAATIWRAALGD